MKTPDGYRFSLQFAANSPEYIQAGETLESLKHKKRKISLIGMPYVPHTVEKKRHTTT